MNGFTIYKLQDGGYFVQRFEQNMAMYKPPLFASADIGECLAYIRDKLDPKPVLTAERVDIKPGSINYAP